MGGEDSYVHPDRSTRARTPLVLQLLDRRDLVTYSVLDSLAGGECGMLVVVFFGKAGEERGGDELIALGERGDGRESRSGKVSRGGSEGGKSRGASERATGQEMNLRGDVGQSVSWLSSPKEEYATHANRKYRRDDAS
jgi:hypothetical protein